MKYSIIVVCLNAGIHLKNTVESVLEQTFTDYEIVIKDGGSKDGSVTQLLEALQEKWPKEMLEEKIRIFVEKDTGIYDAMNQAILHANGEYYLFLNTGDDLYCKTTLQEVNDYLKDTTPDIVYGNLKHKALDTMIYAAPEINDFTCYRNVPCHQTCFYHHRLFQQRGYNPEYNVRADYEHFLWCIYEAKAIARYIPVTVAAYEGGGYSETKENRKRSAKQHREIVLRYMGKKQANHYRRIMWLTLAPLRSKIAESEVLSPLYNFMKTWIYKNRKKGSES